MSNQIGPNFIHQIHMNFDDLLINEITAYINNPSDITQMNSGFRISLSFGGIEKITLTVHLKMTGFALRLLICKLFPLKFQTELPILMVNSMQLPLAAKLEDNVKEFDVIQVLHPGIKESFPGNSQWKTFVVGEDTPYYFVDNTGTTHVKPITRCSMIPFHSILSKDLNVQNINGMELLRQYTGNRYTEFSIRMTFGLFEKNGAPDELFMKQVTAMYWTICGSYQTRIPNKVFRSVYLSDLELSWYKNIEGSYVYLSTFTSTSRRIVFNDSIEKTIMVFLLKPKNRNHTMDIEGISEFEDEEEIILNPCTKLLVKKVDTLNEPPIIFFEFEDRCC